MNPAIRTVSETDDTHIIEGHIAYGGPFNGRDTYGTIFSARTDWSLDLHPQGIPVLFNHGFDDDFGLAPIGMTQPTASFRTDADGLWVEIQLDKRQKYYATRVRPLLDQGALGVSQGSAEHSVRIDAKTGEVLAWPLHEISLTPTESNPWSIVAARSADTIRIVEAMRKEVDPNVGGGVDRDKLPDEDFAGPDRSFPIVEAGDVSDAASSLGRAKGDTASIKANIISIAKRKGFEASLPDAWKEDSARTAVRAAAGDVVCAAGIQAQLAALMDCEDDEPDQLAMLRSAFDAVGQFIAAEAAEIGTSGDEAEEVGPMAQMAYMSAVRAGKRNATADQAGIDLIHDTSVALGTTAHMGGMSPGDETPPAEPSDDAARSGDPVRVTITQPEDPAAVRAALLAKAEEVGLRVVRDRLNT